MENHITQFAEHTDAYIAKTKELTAALAEHKKGLDSAISATVEEARIHKDMTEKAYQTRLSEEKNLRETIEKHERVKKDHEEWLRQKDSQISGKTLEYSNLEGKCNSLETKASMLSLECKNYQNRLSGIMTQVSTVERTSKAMQDEEKRLQEVVTGLKTQEGVLTSAIGDAQKQLSRIREDISILNSRK